MSVENTPSIRPTAIRAGGLVWEAGTIGACDDPPVLLLHGFPEHWRTWAQVMPAIASQGFRVHAVSLPGYGTTTAPDSYDVDVLAGHVAALCRDIGGDVGCHVVGHDWGGIITGAAASLHPDVIRSAALCCCAHPAVFPSGLVNPQQLARSWYVAVFQIPGIERLLGHRLLLERLSPAVSEIDDAQDMGKALAYYRANLRPWRLVASQAGRIQVPALVVHAARDVALTERLMLKTSELCDDLRGFEVLDCGHFIHRTCPSEFLRVILPFLRAVTDPSRAN